MVEIKGHPFTIKYLKILGHGNLIAASGDTVLIEEEELKLFERSLALTGGIEKLPVLYSIQVNWMEMHNMVGVMQAANIDEINCGIYIFNGDMDIPNLVNDVLALDDIEDDIEESDNLIYSDNFHLYDNGVVAFHSDPHLHSPYKGGELLSNEINIVHHVTVNPAPTTNNWFENRLQAYCFFEIFWEDVGKKKVDEYIRQAVYSKK